MFVLETQLDETSLVERKIPNAMDVHRLIAEVYKRPALWNVLHGDHKGRHCIPKLWQEVAQNVGIDVDQCKRKWKNLRDAYRAEVRRSERRIERDKLIGEYDPNTNYNSKWVYFASMSFIGDNRQCASYNVEHENTNSNSNDNNHDNEHFNDSIYNDDNYHSVYDIKLEPSHDNMEQELNHLADGRTADEEDDTANDMLFEEFQNIATPQAARRLSATLSMNNPLERNSPPQQVHQTAPTAKSPNCKCSKRSDDQVHFLQDLGREEQKLMKSTRQDITRSSKLDHVGDSDYNFLVSFLPQMKKMSELQNLQFRARMCDMVLNILAPSVAALDIRNTSAIEPLTDNSAQLTSSVNTINSTSCNNLN
ncbi:serine/threonine-protein kinase atg1-like [Calliphora vicina]|uniref:serine/threonine-protein kinase atg1-like n=1 Tax=Calliphora vicina TaxID=7373 RepID=UPI00325A4566